MWKSILLQQKFWTNHPLSQGLCQLTISSVSGITMFCSNYIIKYNLKVARKLNLYSLPSTKEEPIRKWLVFKILVCFLTSTGGTKKKLRMRTSDPPFQPMVLRLPLLKCTMGDPDSFTLKLLTLSSSDSILVFSFFLSSSN